MLLSTLFSLTSSVKLFTTKIIYMTKLFNYFMGTYFANHLKYAVLTDSVASQFFYISHCLRMLLLQYAI
jgi:hypothetical protein